MKPAGSGQSSDQGLKPDEHNAMIPVSRAELELEHTHLLGRVQQIRRLLGLPPLLTGKQARRERNPPR